MKLKELKTKLAAAGLVRISDPTGIFLRDSTSFGTRNGNGATNRYLYVDDTHFPLEQDVEMVKRGIKVKTLKGEERILKLYKLEEIS